MCGIVGFLEDKNRVDPSILLRKMNAALSRRGPDGNGVFLSPSRLVALGHTRLSLNDLSQTGTQPMMSNCERFIIVFNGEIYNHRELRSKTCYPFRGTSDTETLLATIVKYGVEDAVSVIDGMFAFAVYDQKAQCLFLARDKAGQKPLYYSLIDKTFLFSSDIRAMKVHPLTEASIDEISLDFYLKNGYVAAPRSIYKNIMKLPPGHLLTFNYVNKTFSNKRYDTSDGGIAFDTHRLNIEDALHERLLHSVNQSIKADVEVGCFLSGGIDSTLVTCLAQKQSKRPIKTFTIGTENQKFNEANHAKRVAHYLSTDHTELYVSEETLLTACETVDLAYDEPFADPSKILTFLLSEVAAEKVKAVVSGDGADELFCGYNRYRFAKQIQYFNQFVPSTIRKKILSPSMRAVAHLFNDKMQSELDLKILKLASGISIGTGQDLYKEITELKFAKKVTNFENINNAEKTCSVPFDDILEKMMRRDFSYYLPDNVLVKTDRASMYYGLEVRAPFLNSGIIDFSQNLPLEYKLKNNTTKYILRKILGNYIPETYWKRTKQGFTPPISGWMRGPLANWCRERLFGNKDLFNERKLEHMWSQHQKGYNIFTYDLWTIITFNVWLEYQKKS